MEMTYDGALVMPMGCAMMDEDEMTYLEGGMTLNTTASDIKSRCTVYGAFFRTCALAGAYAGAALIETVVGALASFATASMFWSWAESMANCKAATQRIINSSSKKGNQSVKYTENMSGVTLVLTVDPR